MSTFNISFGTFGFDEFRAKDLQPVLKVLQAQGIMHIDTAETYGSNEADLGAADVFKKGFIISTKNPGGWQPGVAVKELGPRLDEALVRLKVPSVDIFYIHAPDNGVPLTEWVPNVHSLYEQGKFRRFGVSNFSPEDTRALHDYCKANSYVLPTVYQGTYNAVSRIPEARLFPVLRELGISFYDYSAVAGGFLTKPRAAIETGTNISSGRWAGGSSCDTILSDLYRGLYIKPSMLQGLERWEKVAQAQGCSMAELAYRWVYYHSALKPDECGDHVVAGASKLEQIQQTMEGLRRGPLKPEVVEAIDAIWELVQDDAIVDNFHFVASQMSKV